MAKRLTTKKAQRDRRHRRVRARIKGTAERPRLSVYRSSAHLFVQLIDDVEGKTLFSVSDRSVMPDTTVVGGRRVQISFAAGKHVGTQAKQQGITAIVFDRGGYMYHGRVRAVADGARAAGLVF